MTPALSHCTARAFRRCILPLVELQPDPALTAANDPLPVGRLRCVANTGTRLHFFGIEDAISRKRPSYQR